MQAYELLARAVENPAASAWQLTPAGSTITSVRELAALGRAQAIPILPYLLNPAGAAAGAAQAAAEPAAAVEADAAAGASATAVTPAVAAPTAAAAPEASALPPEVSSPAFWCFLQDQYDGPQVEAILRTAAHVMQPQQGAAAAAVASCSTGASPPPVTLIQGPPGTGKTYTVLGVLNLWHMVLYHRYYASLDAVVQRLVADRMPGTRIGACAVCVLRRAVMMRGCSSRAGMKGCWAEGGKGRWVLQRPTPAQTEAGQQAHDSSMCMCRACAAAAAADAVLLAEDFQSHLAPRPRILVCAPSNAAIDELLERVMR